MTAPWARCARASQGAAILSASLNRLYSTTDAKGTIMPAYFIAWPPENVANGGRLIANRAEAARHEKRLPDRQ
jgi:hypothetical protein